MLNTRQTCNLKHYENTTKKNRKRILVTDLCGSTPLAEKAATALVMIVDKSC